jgi:hypothetical protein
MKRSVAPVDAETNREACAPDIDLVRERHAWYTPVRPVGGRPVRADQAHHFTIEVESPVTVVSGNLTSCM